MFWKALQSTQIHLENWRSFYYYLDNVDKYNSWDLLKSTNMSDLRLCSGNFNETLGVHGKGGEDDKTQGLIKGFEEVFQECNLHEGV